MNFTEDKDLAFERLMRQKPGFDTYSRKRRSPKRERDCPRCLYWKEDMGKCSLEKCIAFQP